MESGFSLNNRPTRAVDTPAAITVSQKSNFNLRHLVLFEKKYFPQAYFFSCNSRLKIRFRLKQINLIKCLIKEEYMLGTIIFRY